LLPNNDVARSTLAVHDITVAVPTALSLPVQGGYNPAPMASKPLVEPAEPARFDDILARLRALVERLEGGNLPLEEGLHCFEEGMELCRQGAVVLDKAEKRVEVLLASAGGATTTAPLDEPSADKDEA
jgi:exodeoxyribonuclease VII small subunit